MKRALSNLRVSLVQMQVTADTDSNIQTAVKAISDAAKGGAQVVVLPEIWNGPYDSKMFPKTKEKVPDVGVKVLTKGLYPSLFPVWDIAKKHEVALVAGSISECSENENIYNTSVVFSPSGEVIAKHRKVHLFDIDVPGKITFKESDTLTQGQQVTICNLFGITVGIAICYDVRFPEFFQLMRDRKVEVIIIPAAFNTTTGPKHWQLLMRARAVDYQTYVMACSAARSTSSEGYQAWGHSIVVDPWGEVLHELEEKPGMIEADLDLNIVDEVRTFIPVYKQRRLDVYGMHPLNVVE